MLVQRLTGRAEDQRAEHHHARDRDVERDREQEDLGDRHPRDLAGYNLLDLAWAEEAEDVAIGEQEQHRDP
jgi:hypothetical protein